MELISAPLSQFPDSHVISPTWRMRSSQILVIAGFCHGLQGVDALLFSHTYLKALCLGLIWDLGELLFCQLWFLSCMVFRVRYLWPSFLTLQFSTRIFVVRRQHVHDAPHRQQQIPTPRRIQRSQPGRRISGACGKPGSTSLASGARAGWSHGPGS